MLKRKFFYCRSCGDPHVIWTCGACLCRVEDRCKECHSDLAHGVVGPPPKGKGRYPDYRKTMADDADAFRKEFDL